MNLHQQAWGQTFDPTTASRLATQQTTNKKVNIFVKAVKRARDNAPKAATQGSDKNWHGLVAGQFTSTELSAAVINQPLAWRAVRPNAGGARCATDQQSDHEDAVGGACAQKYGSPAKKKRKRTEGASQRDQEQIRHQFKGQQPAQQV